LLMPKPPVVSAGVAAAEEGLHAARKPMDDANVEPPEPRLCGSTDPLLRKGFGGSAELSGGRVLGDAKALRLAVGAGSVFAAPNVLCLAVDEGGVSAVLNGFEEKGDSRAAEEEKAENAGGVSAALRLRRG